MIRNDIQRLVGIRSKTRRKCAEEAVTSLSELGDSQSVKPEEGEAIYRGSTAGGPHLN